MTEQSLEEVTFSVILSSDWWNNPPNVKIWLNDELIEKTKITELKENKENRAISFKRNLPEGENSLTIELYKKTWDETEVNSAEATEILRDQLLYIDDIEIDDISLGYVAYKQSVFYPDKRLHRDAPDEIKEVNTLGFNGRLVLKFQVPTYIWFLENL